MAVVHMATFLVGYWAPLFRVFLCKPKEIQLPGNKEARLSLRSWLAEKFWFRIKTCVRWHFGFGATLFRKHSFRSKPFLRYFGAKARHFVRALWIRRKVLFNHIGREARLSQKKKKWIRSKVYFLQAFFGFEAR